MGKQRKDIRKIPDGTEAPSRPVFYDPTHHRVWWVSAILLLLLTSAAIALTLLATELIREHALPTSALRPPAVETAAALAPDEEDLRKTLGCTPRMPLDACAQAASASARDALEALPRAGFETYAFLPVWPESGLFSLEENKGQIDVLLPELFTLEVGGEGLTYVDRNAPHMDEAWRMVSHPRGRTRVMPVVRVWTGPRAVSMSSVEMEELAESLADRLGAEIASNWLDGLCMYVDDDGARAGELVVRVFEMLQLRLDWYGKTECLITEAHRLAVWPPNRAHIFERIILAPDQRAAEAAFPGPLEAVEHVREAAEVLAMRSDLDKFVVGLPTGAAEWTTSAAQARQITFVEAMAEAGWAGAKPRYAQAPSNSFTEFAGPRGDVHTIWLNDAASAYQMVAANAGIGIRDFAVWPIGGEDPGVWSLLSDQDDAFDKLIRPDLSRYLSYQGEGPLTEYGGPAQKGLRRFTPKQGPPGTLAAEYLATPLPQRLTRWGNTPPNTFLLTFDDGPDPKFTPRLLDILKQENVPATFFLIGNRIAKNSELVGRMLAEGHTIGSHSYSHPDFAQSSWARIQVELALTQVVLERYANRTTNVFRLPYASGEGPIDGRLARPIQLATEAGYILVMSDIAPPDWELLSSDEIVAHVLAYTETGEGRTLVMHDGGGNRANVVEALPKLIKELRARGYGFAGLPEVVGVPREALVPLAAGEEPLADQITLLLLDGATLVLRWAFWLVIMIGVGRAAIILVASQFDRRHISPPLAYTPEVDVLIPAFCEEDVVTATVQSVLGSDYPNLHITVIDDGSTDRTFEVLEAAFGENPKVTILQKPNGGKASALNFGLTHTEAPLVVALDADTLLESKAISLLLRHFTDPRIGAVAGNVKVGNRVNILTRFQALEYITAQNVDRRAMELVNGILVVPGAIGAWRREAVEAAHGYGTNTLAEDADLTVSINRAGYRVVFEPDAIAITEAPETTRQLFRQRRRWVLGMMQVGWKHKRALRERRGLGLFALPDLFLFGMLMPLLAPIADFVFVLAATGWIDALLTGSFTRIDLPAHEVTIAAYLALPLLDAVIAFLAFHLEPREQRSLLWLLLIQRFWYRQMLYITTIRSIVYMIFGWVGGWQKITRTSSVAAQHKPMPHLDPLPAEERTAPGAEKGPSGAPGKARTRPNSVPGQ